MLAAKLKQKAEEYRKALTEAQRLIAAHREAPTAESKDAMDRATADVTKLAAEYQDLEREAHVAAELERMDRPATRLQTMAPITRERTEEFKAAHAKAFGALIRAAKDNHDAESIFRETMNQLAPAERHLLLGTQGELGGFLVPEDFQARVIARRANFTAVRMAGATVVTTNRDRAIFPTIKPRATGEGESIYPSGFKGAWKARGYVSGGGAPPTQSQPRFGQEEIPVHSWEPDAVEIDRTLIEDSAVNLEEILARIIGQTMGLDEDLAFLRGTGAGEPEGVLQAGITAVPSGAAAITYAGLVDLSVALPAQYRGTANYLMNSKTYGAILKLTDNEGRPIIPANSTPGTLWSRPIRFSEFMDDPDPSMKPVIFGDFAEYYIVERSGLRVQRLEERYAPNLGILPTARIGGQVVVTDAFRVQSLAAS